VTQRLSQRF